MPRIAIPMPHSSDPEYSERAIPQYERAVQLAGGEAVRISLDQSAAEIMKIARGCDAVLLPGSKADIDPAKFHSERSPHTASADARRTTVDELLLQDAYEERKPIFGICYGLQSLNVYRGGSLIQHIPDFLPEELRARVNHEAGKQVAIAHTVEIESGSRLAQFVAANGHVPEVQSPRSEVRSPIIVPVNSSHHQSAAAIGQGLRLVARCPDDGIIEALEGTASDHFVIAVQWHPERSVEFDEPSRTIFRAFVSAAAKSQASPAGT
jgi:putative glutamine amidotransferase